MKHIEKRVLSLLVVLALLAGFVAPVRAMEAGSNVQITKVDNDSVSANLLTEFVETESNTKAYSDTDVVRVSIVLEEQSTIEAGFSTTEIVRNTEAMAYRAGLQDEQLSVTASIEREMGGKLDVVWNLTLAANIISANVEYGQIEAIEAVAGVREVLIETLYRPDVVSKEETVSPEMATSTKQIGSPLAWNAGYTGAGTRIAVIDTGTDVEHQSFDNSAFQYSLAYRAGLCGMSVEEYIASLDLLDAAEIAEVADYLNADINAEQAYLNPKLPFGYNYVDEDYDISHINDYQGEHGSHVAGISVANAYIPNGNGGFVNALSSAYVQGVAPDAQLITMKVFGKNGGAYDSDYMAAIEDAIILGCDAVNLSLGSGNPGNSRNSNQIYQAFLEGLVNSGTVVTMSAGNSGSWVENAYNVGYLYAEDVSMQTNGAPGSFTNSLAVASVDNDGYTSIYIAVGDEMIFYNETDYTNLPFTTIAGEQEYVFIDGLGTAEDWAAVGEALQGKIALCSRGGSSFFEKAKAAVDAGAIATIIYNNQPGVLNMDLTDYAPYTQPVASITQAEGAAIKAASTPVTDDAGNVLYYAGTMTVSADAAPNQFDSEYYTMSSFSSWGVPGSLELKPEITAPGGNIYSVYGKTPQGGGSDRYELMSGTSVSAPQVAGMAALTAQYIRENALTEKTGLDARTLAQSLLMSTAVPLLEAEGKYYPVIQQGAGLANIGAVVTADSYILMSENATTSYADGKVKAELGDDPERTGEYTFSFTIHNLTDVEKSFALAADLFIQSPIEGPLNNEGDMGIFMDTATALVGADVTWQVNGVAVEPAGELNGLDFNGDGVVNCDDGQALLDYATGVLDTLSNEDKADLDADGDIDTYDAYLFLSRLSSGTAMVPANGSTEVTVTAVLSEEWKATINSYYPNGTYIQGYVYAESLSDAEGNQGTSHSIPMLAFFGNWSDPSMFEVGSYQEYSTGDEVKIPYIGNMGANSFAITYGDEPNELYIFGGNPLIADETYMPERNAINSLNGDKISMVSFAAIRNAAASRLLATNLTTGKILAEGYPGAVDAAYYNPNYGEWYNVNYLLNTKVNPRGAAEGDVLEVLLTLAPEYYVDAEGNADWDALGEGATYGITATVDNTAPVLENVYLDLKNNCLVVKASDNQYVAAAVLYNRSGTRPYTGVGAKQDIAPGESAEYVLDLTGVNGRRFMLQVVDYAMNTATYALDITIGTPVDYTGKIVGFTEGDYFHLATGPRWVELDKDNLFFYYVANNWGYVSESDYGGVSNLFTTDLVVKEAEYVGGYVYMVADDGNLYVAEQEDMGYYEKVCYVGDKEIVGMAMNHADGKMYVMTVGEGDYNFYQMTISTMDLVTGEFTSLYDVEVVNPDSPYKYTTRLHGLAIDDAGNFYTVNYDFYGTQSYLYSWTNEMAVDGKISNLSPVGDAATGFQGNAASLAWDHDEDILYMATINDEYSSTSNMLITLDTETGVGAKASQYDGGYGSDAYASLLYFSLSGLYIVPSSGPEVNRSNEPYNVILDQTELDLLTGANFTLHADVYPWTMDDKSLSWSTSDPNVAIVDGSGNVTTVGAGTATITATTNATPAVSASCTLNVSVLEDVKLTGLVYDVDGSPYWSDFVTDELPNWTIASGKDNAYIAGALMGDQVYLHDGSSIYAVDADTFEVTQYGKIASQWQWSDAAPAYEREDGSFGMLVGLADGGQALAMIDPAAGTGMQAPLPYQFEDDPAAVIALKEEGIYNYYGTVYPANYYYVITDGGVLYECTVLSINHGDGYSPQCAKIGETGLNLSGVSTVTGGVYASMLYDTASGYLLLSAYTEGETAKLYAIHPDVLIPAELGDFGEKVWPVVSLYQYDRPTDLTVRLNVAEAAMYEKETLQVEAKVVLGTSKELVWTSSDENVATVDENGLITAVGGGQATITATTVATNREGNTVSATVAVTVTDLWDLDASINAQLVTGEKAEWVSIDTSDLTATKIADASTVFSGAGYGGSNKIYGTKSDFETAGNFYQVDMSNGYAETVGARAYPYLAVLDMTHAPAMEIQGTDANGETVTRTAFDKPLFISNSQYLAFLDDYATGDMTAWYNAMYYNGDIGALAYIQNTIYMEAPAQMFMGLGADGTLYQFIITATYDAATDSIRYGMADRVYGSTGMKFDSYQTLSMIYDGTGLIVSDSSQGAADLYYVDLTGETLTGGKVGRLPEATGITGLYTDVQTDNANAVDVVATAAAVEAAQINTAEAEPELSDAVAFEAISLAGESTNAQAPAHEVIKPNSDASAAPAEDTVTLNITTDVAATNGLATITYDTGKLALETVVLNGTYTSKLEEDGKLTFGYVSLTEIPAEGTIATLTFKVLAVEGSTITVEHKQVNNTVGVTETLAVGFDHDNTEIRGAIEATCTEDGYTGDTYCLDCGQMIKQGEVIPATGHSYSEWTVTKAATCFAEGEEIRTCATCGETETRAIPVRTECPSDAFTDLDKTQWYHEGVDFVLDNGLMKGMSDTIFAPNGEVTRAQLVTILYRLGGQPSVEGLENPFEDVAETAWYAEAVIWAVNAGVVNGTSATTFDPNTAITREQIAAILFRYSGAEKVEEDHLEAFADADQISAYAVDAMNWAVSEGLITGMGNGTVAPRATATRAQIATILMRYCN